MSQVQILPAVGVNNTTWTEIVLPNSILGGVDIQLDTGNAFQMSISQEQTDTVNGTLDTPLSLTYGDISDVGVTSADGLTTYTVTTDYTIDAANGTITLLSTGTMLASTDYLVTYNYYPYFRGVPGLTMNQNMSKESIFIQAEEASANVLVMCYTEKR